MFFACAMDGSLHSFHLNEFVARSLVSTMPLAVLMKVSPSVRHCEIRDITANVLTEVCQGVGIESHI